MPKCVRKGGDGRIVPSAGGGKSVCAWFEARRSCTTCEHRCSIEERGEFLGRSAGCGKWELRRLGSWGGARRSSADLSGKASRMAQVQPESKENTDE